jgi:hypothetical protein
LVVRNKAALTVANIVWLFCRSIAAAPAADRYPGSEWDRIAPEQAGWSASELDAAQKWSTLIGTTSVVIIQRGAIVASWGDVSADILLNSARKSLLSALIGIAVGNHQIDLNDTLARLGIDDNAPSLTPDEKQATVADLLEARSGVYHGANYETLKMAALKPPRGSHPHGTFWYYNNWISTHSARSMSMQPVPGSLPRSRNGSHSRSGCRTSIRASVDIPAAPLPTILRICSSPVHAISRGSACCICVADYGATGRSFLHRGWIPASNLIPRPIPAPVTAIFGGRHFRVGR